MDGKIVIVSSSITKSDTENWTSGTNIPATNYTPSGFTNAIGDGLLLFVTLAEASGVPTITTPSGWNVIETGQRVEDHRAYAFGRVATAANETLPDLICSATPQNWVVATMVMRDIDTTDFIGDSGITISSSSVGDMPSITTTKANSYIVHWIGGEASGWAGKSGFTKRLDKNLNIENLQLDFNVGASNERAGGVLGHSLALTLGDTVHDVYYTLGSHADHILISFEVKMDTITDVPLVVDKESSLTSLPTPTESSDGTPRDGWMDAVMDSNVNLLTGEAPQTYSFDAATDVDPTTDEITITANEMQKARTYRADANGNTLPTGLTDDAYYWHKKVDADTFQVADLNRNVNGAVDYFQDGSLQLSAVNITADGTGTCRFIECGMVNAPESSNGITDGDAGDAGESDGDYLGDCGYSVNWCGLPYYYSTPINFGDDFLVFQAGCNDLPDRVGYLEVLMIDTDGDWKVWTIYDRKNTAQTHYTQVINSSTRRIKWIQPKHSIPRAQAGTFNADAVEWIVFGVNGAGQGSTFGAMPAAFWYELKRLTAWEVSGNATLDRKSSITTKDLTELIDSFAGESGLAQTSTQQALRCPVKLTGSNLNFTGENISFGFAPQLSIPDNSSLDYHFGRVGIDLSYSNINDSAEFKQSQFSGLPTQENYLSISAPSGASVDFDNTSFLNSDITLDADFTYTGNLFVNGILTDNNATIRNWSFVIGEAVGSDNGTVTWGSSTDIQNSSFSLSSGVTTGHAIIITTPGTYAFTNLTFTGFGATGSNTAAVYNNSGGAVTINVSGGTTPSVRNGAGSTTTVSAGVPVTVTVLDESATPIQGASVYMEVTGSVEVLDGVTNASGIITTTYSGGTPISITKGKVSFSSALTPLQAQELVGSITSTGYNQTVTLIED